MAREVNTKKRKSNYKKQPKNKVNYDVMAVIIIFVGIFVGVSMFTDVTGIVGAVFKKLLMGLFGVPAYILCFAMIACSIHYIAKKQLGKYKRKYIFTAVFVTLLCAFWQIVGGLSGIDPSDGIINTIVSLWKSGIDGTGGGVAGGIIGIPMEKLLSFWGSAIVLVAIMLVLIICIFEISIADIVKFLRDKMQREYETMEEEEVEKAPEKMPPEMQRELKKIKKQIFDFEKEFADMPDTKKKPKKKKDEGIYDPVADMPDVSEAGMIDDLPPFIQDRVQGTAEPDKSAIEQAIDFAAEESLLPKKKKKAEEPVQMEIEVVSDHIDYAYPSLTLLDEPKVASKQAAENLQRKAKTLIDTLHSFGVEAKIVDYCQGPTITRYELQPSEGVKISKITNLADDIALKLGAVGIRIEPIPGKTVIGIEVPNDIKSPVSMREVLGTADFANFESKLAFALGKDIAGKTVVGDIARMPHLLIAGTTGSGKSVCLNTIIISMLYKAAPNEVKLVMIDPKAVELQDYNGIPHLLIPVVTDPRKAAGALQWAVNEMTNRYKMFAENNVRNIKGYNSWAKKNGQEEIPQIVIIIDELSDLMMVAPNDVEDSICRLAQMARAAGMHLIIATQRPSVDVVTGLIKANIPSRIALTVRSFVDSKTMLDMGGAEKLLGNGDMLYFPIGTSKPIRVQGAYVSNEEIKDIINFVKGQNEANYDEDVIEKIERAGETPKASEDRGREADELLPQAIEMAIEAKQASVAMYQRRLKVGYQRAARLIDQMEERGVIGPFDGTKPREVLITKAQWNEMMINMDLGMGTPDEDEEDYIVPEEIM